MTFADGAVRGVGIPDYSKSVRLLILQPTPFCNIDCTYCYLPGRSNKQTLRLADLSTIIHRLVDDDMFADFVEVCWHAGEPLVAGISYFEAAFRTIRDIIPPRVGINHTIQTNGTLIDDDWCSFFRTYDVSLGLSLDGPEHIHDRARKTRSGRGTFTRVIDAITLLKSNNVDFHIICVLTRYGLERYQEICDFFAELELREVCYNIDESDGVNISSVLGSPDVAYPLTRNLFRGLLEVATLPDQKMWIRELNKMLARLAAVSAGYQSIPNDLVEPLNILTVTHDGGWSTFSPELAGITSATYSNFIFGNLTRESIYDGIA
jgi:uncharacterized protein